jgi:ABC-2 type transport system permease protein
MGITGEGTIIEKGKPGKLLLVASSRILWNNVLDEGGESTTSTFVMNLLDYLNGRDAYAAMRSKMQRFNPLTDSAPAVKAFVKTFNIAGLPVIVILSGIVVWMRRTSRKRVIQTMFMK